MKANFMKFLSMGIMIFLTQFVFAQVVTTIVQDVPAEVIDLRLFKNINIDSLKQEKTDSYQYLKDIEVMEGVIRKNFKELDKQFDFINNEIKLVNSDNKLMEAKKKTIQADEKLLRQEQKLRDNEIKAFDKEKKEFKKISKKMSQADIDARTSRFMDNDARIEKAKVDWNRRQEKIKDDNDLVNKNEYRISRRDIDVQSRYNELKRYEASLRLKEKQLKVEKKQVQLDIKKANLDMESANS